MKLALRLSITSSSAVAKRPRDASCLSVVSFNSTMFIRFDIICERDRHTDTRTDGQTPHDGTGLAYA